jgi:hypothetical protein
VRRDPREVVAGFLLALEDEVRGAGAEDLLVMRLHAVYALRRASEKFRLDLISDGQLDERELAAFDEDIRDGVHDIRRAYVSVAFRATQRGADA